MNKAEAQMLKSMVTVAGLALSLAGDVSAQSQDAALVGTDDLLNVRVLEWDPIAGEVKLWEEVTGEYRVASDGTITVPFAGRVEGAGQSPDQIATTIISAIRERLALTTPPDVTVEIAEQRPVIVTGDVQTPGPYAFNPGMLAVEAVGLAGGTGRFLPDQAAYMRELTVVRTSLAVLQNEEVRMLARQARLEAELDGRSEIEPEGGVPEDPEWTSIIALEQQLMQVRADRLERELIALDSQSELFAAEIQALEQKTVSLNRQRELASEAASNADDLVDRGLVAGQRLLETQNALATIDTQLLDVSTAILRARQDLASAERERIGLQDTRRAEILEELQVVDASLQDTRDQIGGAQATIQALQTGQPVEIRVEPTITILRRGSTGLERIEDAAMLPLRPGDMVEVRQPIQFSMDLAAGVQLDTQDPEEDVSLDEVRGVPRLPAAPASEVPASEGGEDSAEADLGEVENNRAEERPTESREVSLTSENPLGETSSLEQQAPTGEGITASIPDGTTVVAPASSASRAEPPMRPVSRPNSFN